jgi:hypothetical protein
MNKAKLKALLVNIKKEVANFDLFGKPINLNFNDDEVYKTQIGGCFSILFVTLIIFFFWTSVTICFFKNIFLFK